ncbi:MAG: HAD family hydrolase [Spirochaetes bacterium]|nr:HAD family hydrolase [Spirochaetota bacterium]
MVRAVLFDFDGTLTRPGSLDFAAIRRAIGCPAGRPILEFIESLDDDEARRKAFGILDALELEAARRSEPNEAAEETIRTLAARGLPAGILSRNSRASVREALERFPTLRERDFAAIVCREDVRRQKPHPDGVHAAAARLGCAAADLVVVGDYVFDIDAGMRAGSHTVLLANGTPPRDLSVTPDAVIDRLSELLGVIEKLDQRRCSGP